MRDVGHILGHRVFDSVGERLDERVLVEAYEALLEVRVLGARLLDDSQRHLAAHHRVGWIRSNLSRVRGGAMAPVNQDHLAPKIIKIQTARSVVLVPMPGVAASRALVRRPSAVMLLANQRGLNRSLLEILKSLSPWTFTIYSALYDHKIAV